MATINVTSTADSGAGTLRQAITDLNAQTGSHTITFTGLTGTITLASALPTLNRSMTITGPGLSNLTISGNNLYRVFVLASTFFTFNISGLTIANGRAAATNPGYFGGGIYNPLNGVATSTLNIDSCYFTGCYSGFGLNGLGSAIYTQGNLTVTNTSFVNNSGISAETPVVASIGGTATIGNCTFSGNAGVPYFNNANGSCTIYNCTFSGNSGGSNSGGIIFATNASVSLLSSTISGNTGTNGSGLYVGEYVSLTLKNSIISGNTGSNDFYSYQNNRTVASAATNIIGTISTASATSAARVIGDPLLVALASNGGLTQTMAVSAGSVAIGAGTAAATNAAPVSALDQRGTARSATTPTIGAFEFTGSSSPPTVSSISPSTGTALGGTSVTITGANLTGATSVTIGGVAATSVTVVNSTTITATTPAGTAGSASVLVTTPSGTNAANTLFTYTVTNTIRIKRSSTTTVAPTSLLEGELAANIIDKKIWIGNSSKSPVLISDYNNAGGSGTVTSASVVSANGFSGTVATATTTPAITISTSITGVLKGNGTAISAAVSGTDYIAPSGALGTPSSGTLTSCTGLPIATGVSGLGTNVASFLATPSSANLAAALTDETGTGANVFATSPLILTPTITGLKETKTAPTISSGTLTLNCALGNVFHVSLNADVTTLTISNIPASGTAYALTLAFTADGTTRSVAWPASVKWIDGISPNLTITNGQVDIFVLTTWDGGSTFYAMIGGQNF